MMNREKSSCTGAGKAHYGLTGVRAAPFLVEVGDTAKEVTHAELAKHIQRFDVAAVSCSADVSLLLLVSGTAPSDVWALPTGASRLIPLEPGNTLKMTSLKPGVARLEVLIPYRLPQ